MELTVKINLTKTDMIQVAEEMELKDLLGVVAARLITGENRNITAVNELLAIQKKICEAKKQE